jgi:hypothetical protein
MPSGIYAITGNGLRAIHELDLSTLQTGQTVTIDQRYHSGEHVIYRTASDVLAINTEDMHIRRPADLKYAEPEVAENWYTQEESERFYQLAALFQVQTAEMTAKAAEYKAKEKARMIAELRTVYTWAVKSETMSSYARAAKNMKKELEIAFPGVKFSVKSKSYSGGDSVTAYWTDGPSSKAVEAIIGKYAYGSFDGMDDSYNYDHSPYSEAIGEVLGQSKYVSESQTISDAVMAEVYRALCESYGVENEGPNTRIDSAGEWLSTLAYRALCGIDIPATWTKFEAVWSDGATGYLVGYRFV